MMCRVPACRRLSTWGCVESLWACKGRWSSRVWRCLQLAYPHSQFISISWTTAPLSWVAQNDTEFAKGLWESLAWAQHLPMPYWPHTRLLFNYIHLFSQKGYILMFSEFYIFKTILIESLLEGSLDLLPGVSLWRAMSIILWRLFHLLEEDNTYLSVKSWLFHSSILFNPKLSQQQICHISPLVIILLTHAISQPSHCSIEQLNSWVLDG